jgi:hypothetical protein
MTAPPGGPYGHNPYGTNPSGQEPHWAGQPQGGPNPYPPGGPYGAPYPPQQPPPPGPGFPRGAPPGPPPRRPRSKLPWLIAAGVAVLAVVAVVVILVVNSRDGNKSAPASASAPTSPPNNSQQTATDCTPNASAGQRPTGNKISAGRLSFPSNVAPGWSPGADDQSPNLIGAVGVAQEVPGISDWMMEAEVAITNFVPSMDVTAQATKLMQCVANGPGYADAAPTLGPMKTSPMMIDGVKATRVDADIVINDPTRNTKGDSVTIIAVDTKPVTVFMGARPIGDPGNAATINQVIAALKVSKR